MRNQGLDLIEAWLVGCASSAAGWAGASAAASSSEGWAYPQRVARLAIAKAAIWELLGRAVAQLQRRGGAVVDGEGRLAVPALDKGEVVNEQVPAGMMSGIALRLLGTKMNLDLRQRSSPQALNVCQGLTGKEPCAGGR